MLSICSNSPIIYQSIKSNPEIIIKIKPLINQYNLKK